MRFETSSRGWSALPGHLIVLPSLARSTRFPAVFCFSSGIFSVSQGPSRAHKLIWIDFLVKTIISPELGFQFWLVFPVLAKFPVFPVLKGWMIYLKAKGNKGNGEKRTLLSTFRITFIGQGFRPNWTEKRELKNTKFQKNSWRFSPTILTQPVSNPRMMYLLS